MSDPQLQKVTETSNLKEAITKHEESEIQIIEPSSPVKQTESTTYGSVDNEIWATITPQQNASLEALHQSMRLGRNSTDEDFRDLNSQQQQQQKQQVQQVQQAQTQQAQQAQTPQNQQLVSQPTEEEKPAVGSEEWHRQRRENHKQVERRRRENINEGISEIARIVPGCEKNKGSILNRAATYIRQLKDNEAATLEKWTLEKLLTDQAISELNRQVEVFKSELERVKQENSYLKRELDNAKNTESKSKKQKTDIVQDE